MLAFWISRNQFVRTARRRRASRRRPLFEALEGRQLLSTFNVTNTSDKGAGSLRQAIISSNAMTGSSANAIDFQIGTGGRQLIALLSALPPITHPVVIDGTTQPGSGAAPRIAIDGSGAGNAVGLRLNAPNTTIKGLAVDNFGSDGIAINSASGDWITDDYIGLTPAGTNAGNGGNGVTISGRSTANTVGGTAALAGNVISDNNTHGVAISGADDNVAQGNLIGTNAAGNAARGNGDSGIYLTNGADGNQIGGTTVLARNVLSGNNLRGIHIAGCSSGNLVEGNFIGTNAAGTAAVANDDSGVLIDGNSNNNTIGGASAGAGNVLSGNGLRGLHISEGSSGNLIVGNLIGTNAKGTAAVPNADSGVLIDCGSASNTVGGTTAGAANTISDNMKCGVALDGAGHSNLVEGDVIDSNGAGKSASGAGDGVSIVDTAYTSVINCTIELNRDWGILVKNGAHTVVTGNTFQGNGLGDVHIS
jgi:parallel beta-helix repeat protein